MSVIQMDLAIRHCIAGLLIAFVFGAAYVFEVRYKEVYKEVNKQIKELSSLKLTDLQTKVEMLEKNYKTNAEELETEKRDTEKLKNRIEVIEKAIDTMQKKEKSMEANSGCPEGWIPFRSSCYVFIHKKKHWADAEGYCVGLNSYLANIGDVSENQFLRTQLQLHGNQEDFWVGATDAMVEGDWRWLPKFNYVVYNDWSKGEPNDRGNQDCIDLEYGRQYQWDDDCCDTLKSFICEKIGEKKGK